MEEESRGKEARGEGGSDRTAGVDRGDVNEGLSLESSGDGQDK